MRCIALLRTHHGRPYPGSSYRKFYLKRRRLMRTRLVPLLFATLLVSVGLLAVDDPLIGTWQLNLAKSKYNPGPPPKSQILNYTPFGNKGLKVRAEIVDAQGNKTVTEYSANYDAKDYPVTGSPDADTVSMKH